METLETDRLLVRKMVLDDCEDVTELLTNKFDYFNGPFQDDECVQRRIDWIVSLSNWRSAGGYYGDRVVVLKDSDTLIGLCGIDPWLWKVDTKKRVSSIFSADPVDLEHTTIEFELGYALKERFRGHGYATEAVLQLINWAFSEGKVRRVLARTSLDNHASIKMMTRIGMQVCKNEEWGGAAGIIRKPETVRH